MKVRPFWLGCLALGCVASASSLAWSADPPKPPDAAKPGPKVDDPMLEPVPPAAKNIANWNEARDHIKARSTDLRIALEDIKRADAASRAALASALPSIVLQGVGSYQILPSADVETNPASPTQTLTQPPFTFRASASLSVPIFDLQKWYAIGTANRAVDVAKLTVEDSKRVLLLGVVSAMVAVYTSERVAEVGRIGLRSSLERYELTKQRVSLGAGNKLDVLRAEADVATARATLVTNNESLRQARDALGLALGYPTGMGVASDLKLDAIENDARGICKGAASLDERADVLALHKRIETAKRSHTEAGLYFFPTATLQTALSKTTAPGGLNQATGQVIASQTQWSIQGVLTFNLWDGGARYANLRDTAAQADQAEQKLEALMRKATIEITQAKRAVTVAEAGRAAAQQARDAAFDTDRLTQTAYTEGRGTSLELVTAAANLRQAEINLALREFELVRARILSTLILSRCDL